MTASDFTGEQEVSEEDLEFINNIAPAKTKVLMPSIVVSWPVKSDAVIVLFLCVLQKGPDV